MRVIGQKLLDVNPKLYTKLVRLNMRSNGEMQKTTRALRRRKDNNAFVNYILKEDKVIGWNLQYKVASIYNDGVKGYFNHFYVRHSHRRSKYGEALLKAAYDNCVRYNEECIVSPWDGTSRNFFNRMADKYGLKLRCRDVFSFYW